jgi:hypothetical protein
MSILKSKHSGWSFDGTRTPFGGGGKGGGGPSGGGTTQQANQYSNISPWASPYVASILGAAQQQVFKTQNTPATAGYYTDAQGNKVDAATAQADQGSPFGGGSQFNYVEGTPASTEITGMHPYNAYGYQGAGMTPEDIAAAEASVAKFTPLQQQAFTGAGNLQVPGQYGQATTAANQGINQAMGAGAGYQQMATDPNSIAAYMNPYLQQSLNPQLQLLAQQTGIQSAAQQGAATQKGAFGGSRSALANALSQQAGNMAAQQAIGQGYNQAFNNAQQAQQFGANLGLQGAQAGITGANTLAGIGGQELAARQGILDLQNKYGTQQQQQQQNVINQGMQNYATGQQYPMTQLQQLAALGAPYVTKDVTTTQQQATPSAISQLAGLGTAGIAGLGMYNAMNKKP